MEFRVSKFIDAAQRERVELSPEARQKYASDYAAYFAQMGYRRDAANATQYDALMRYCADWLGNRKKESDKPKKGLFLKGFRGTGKSAFFQRFSAVFDVPYISVSELTKAYAIGEDGAFWGVVDEFRYKHLIVDDLGNESANKKFGNTLPLPDFIAARYDAFLQDGIYTFFTSNAKDENEIAQKYGDWVLSRINEMCFIITLGGGDRRLK